MKPPPASPPWGDPAQFIWSVHGLGYDYFLLEHAPGAPDPFQALPAGAVTRVFSGGVWRLYRRDRLPLPGE
jgi:hypothetical protein